MIVMVARTDRVDPRAAGVPKQPDDPAALGEALVQIANVEHPLKVFAAGSDALDAITLVVEPRLAELRQHADLSKTAGGAFTPAGST
jgi:hypothetical protein